MLNAPPLLRSLMAPLQHNGTFAMTLGTSMLCALMLWWYGRSTRAQLLQTQQNCRVLCEGALQECRALLKKSESSWGSDLRERDAQVRRLELQNVEQTRSVARLEAAVRACFPDD